MAVDASRHAAQQRPGAVPTVQPVAADPFAAIDVAAARLELVALGGTLDSATLRSAYRHGVFPWPAGDGSEAALEREAGRLSRRGVVRLPGPDGLVPWCSPDPRAVLLSRQVRVSRSLRRTLRRSGWHCSLDAAFDQVVAACADREEGSWITPRMREAYGALHADGDAHSVEVWDGGRLVGGLYGVLVGRVFCGESMFHRATDASKVALVDLCARLEEAGAPLVDVQQATGHLLSLGAVLIAREEYLGVLAALREDVVRLPPDRLPASRLAP